MFSNLLQADDLHRDNVRLPSSEFDALVSYVVDGDSVEIEYQGDVFKLRLLGVDAPEKFQDYAEDSRLHLSDLISDRYVKVKVFGEDYYGRWLARLSLNNTDVNLDLVEQGSAWCFFFSKSEHRLFYEQCMAVQEEAQANKKGLWLSDQVVRPSEWRKNLRDEAELRESEQQAIDDLVSTWIDKLKRLIVSCKQWFVSLFNNSFS